MNVYLIESVLGQESVARQGDTITINRGASRLVELILGEVYGGDLDLTIEASVHCGQRSRIRPSGELPTSKHVATKIVNALLDSEVPISIQRFIDEATVDRPSGATIWMATFTGPDGKQVYKSTGTPHYKDAMKIARRLENMARAQRARQSPTPPTPTIRVRRRELNGPIGPLTQREIALLIGLTERAVRAIEKRALRKLFAHPQLREIWRQYNAGELDEHRPSLDQQEIEALFGLGRTPQEHELISKVLQMLDQ